MPRSPRLLSCRLGRGILLLAVCLLPQVTLAEDLDPASAVNHSAARTFEQRLNDVIGAVNRRLAAVIFYDIGGRSTTVSERGIVPSPEGIRPLLEKLEAQGVNPREADLRLVLPQPVSEDARQTLEQELTSRYCTGPRSFEVAYEIPAGSTAETLLVANRSGIMLAVLWLIVAAAFFTLRMRFINFRAFKHALLITAGKYDNPQDSGEVSHFQALSAALSATVGMGNIAGVAVAISIGGPGATFWLIIAGLLGMSSKMVECTLGIKYREIRADGRVMGGAMFYLSQGLGELGLGRLGRVLAFAFAVMCIGGSFAGGNAYQVNQSLDAIKETVVFFRGNEWVYGALMTFLTGIVIIGGIRRIAATADKIVPLMCGVYVVTCLYILIAHASHIPAAFLTIVHGAFTPAAGYGGVLGVMVMGFRRAAFSNEAGVGSAAIAHSAAKTPYAVREGIVALLEPFVDTVMVCTMTALVIVITGAYDASNSHYADLIHHHNGAALTSRAFGSVIPWFHYVLSLAVFLFAYSTLISWSYYGERCWAYLFGDKASMGFRIIFLTFTFLGSVMSATQVLEFGDLMILGMAFPNLVGVVLLSGKVRRDLDDYWKMYKAGEFDRHA